MPRPLKKSETLEIRLPHPTKQAFMARCRDDGRSASEALRGFIEQQIDDPTRPAAPRWGRWIAGAVLAAAAGAVALPSLARTTSDFQHLDANRDGGMTVTVGRLRPCPLFDYKFVALGHNTIRGAAGAAILNAELMHREGLL